MEDTSSLSGRLVPSPKSAYGGFGDISMDTGATDISEA